MPRGADTARRLLPSTPKLPRHWRNKARRSNWQRSTRQRSQTWRRSTTCEATPPSSSSRTRSPWSTLVSCGTTIPRTILLVCSPHNAWFVPALCVLLCCVGLLPISVLFKCMCTPTCGIPTCGIGEWESEQEKREEKEKRGNERGRGEEMREEWGGGGGGRQRKR